MASAATRVRARVRGRVQGVGFRPFVWKLARLHGLGGWVLNDADGVLLEVEGSDCDAFIAALRTQAPPLSRIDSVTVQALACIGSERFEIAASRGGEHTTATVPADVAVCEDCLREMFDPADRRWRYPFINCTQCGPRFTITAGLPYDRPQTAMAGFALCPDCAREYRDPADRRYHAQPVACPVCGPRLDTDPAQIVVRLMRGEIVALKGLGGFHLACDARNAEAVARLRLRKGRDRKPFAVMALNAASARAVAELSEEEHALLGSRARPVVVVRARGVLPEAVSGGLPTLGLMLAYAPLHHLIFHEAAGRPSGSDWLHAQHDLVLVMTSANPAGEPLVIGDDEAHARLDGIADAIVGHDRPILTRCDDSVTRVVAGAPVFLRRSRGYVPDAIRLAESGPPVLALGALLKCCTCLLREDEAVLSQHVGDIDSSAAYAFLGESVAHLERLLRVAPQAIACDRHPDYPTSRYARESGLPVIAVQHHHAHLAAVAAEYGITGSLTGLILDGFGLGDDGTLWGGELLRMNASTCERRGHLAPLALPGGDAAARAPWRMAAAVLHALGRGDEIVGRMAQTDAARVAHLLDRKMHTPSTTACGRLFDAAAGLLGVRAFNTFEGEAAMALEALCTRPRVLAGGWRLHDGVLDFSVLLDALIDRDPADGADLFHGTLAAGLADLALHGLDGEQRLAIAGGCAVNRPLLQTLRAMLARDGVELLIPRQAPPGDGGLALGQALVARRILRERN
jgi:hydrogenase maturation protein HypF